MHSIGTDDVLSMIVDFEQQQQHEYHCLFRRLLVRSVTVAFFSPLSDCPSLTVLRQLFPELSC